MGHDVTIPKFPTPKNQNLTKWMEIFSKYQGSFDEDTVFIGHSLGVSFLLSVLEKSRRRVKACFFVAGFIGNIGIDEFDSINSIFTVKNFDWNKINSSCDNFFVYSFDNAPYVDLEKGYELSTKLNTNLQVIKNAGHINKASGFTKFTYLLEEIKKTIKN